MELVSEYLGHRDYVAIEAKEPHLYSRLVDVQSCLIGTDVIVFF